jgi:phosphomannomutase
MIDSLKLLQKHCHIAIVGGSDLLKIKEQVGNEVVEMMDFCFSQNGLYSLKNGIFLA